MSPLHQQNSSLASDLFPHSTSFDGAGSTITSIVFGILALVVGVVTIWQAYCTYRVWYPATIGTSRPGCSINLIDLTDHRLRRQSWSFSHRRTRDEDRNAQPRQHILGASDCRRKAELEYWRFRCSPCDCLHSIATGRRP